ncbi:MAG: hypothetical protein GY811_13900 [Myxococcales bacterium]|nr:hypothetical protein [Myxococcales bacterium]
MNKASKSILLAIALSTAACGSPSDPKTPAHTATPVVAADSPTVVVGEPATPQLPNVPATPAEAPAELTAVFTAGNPNAQITQIGTFVDAVLPGMAAFVTPQTLMKQIEGILGVVGLRGIDLNQPLHMIMLDDQQAVLVATVASEAEISDSLQGTKTMVMLHDGYAAIGKFDALHKSGAYGLSNLATADVPELPMVRLHLGKIMSGPHAPMVREQLKNQLNDPSGDVARELLLTAMSNIEVLSVNFDGNSTNATIRLIGEGIGGELKQFLAKQRSSSFSMLGRLGAGPWSVLMGGRLDLTAFLPLLVELGEAQAQPMVTHLAAQLGGLNGEMGVAINVFPKREFVVGMEVADGKSLAQLIDNLLGMIGKKKELDIAGMKGKLRLGSIKTRDGSIHEVKLTPTTEKLKKDYGKRGVSAFFGIVADTLLVTFGPSAKAQARTLASKSGNLSGKGVQLAKSIEQAKTLDESFFMAFDILGWLQSEKPAQDGEPVVLGIGFTADTFTGRLAIPTSVVRDVAQGVF